MQQVSEETGEDTPVVPYSRLEVLRRKATPDRYVAKSSLGRLLSRIACSAEYMATLAKDEVLEGAYTSGERGVFRALQRDCDESYQGILARANAHVERLGRGYRATVQSEVIHGVVTGRIG